MTGVEVGMGSIIKGKGLGSIIKGKASNGAKPTPGAACSGHYSQPTPSAAEEDWLEGDVVIRFRDNGKNRVVLL